MMKKDLLKCQLKIRPGVLRYSATLNAFNLSETGRKRIASSRSVLSKFVFQPPKKLRIKNSLDISTGSLEIEAPSRAIFLQLVYSLINPTSLHMNLISTKCPLIVVPEYHTGNLLTTKIETFLFQNICLMINYSLVDSKSITKAINCVLIKRDIDASTNAYLIKKPLMKKIVFEVLLQLNLHHFILIDSTLPLEEYFEMAKHAEPRISIVYFSQSSNTLPSLRLI